MAIDTKYGWVTTEHGTIGEDEPVVVFRSMDRLLPKVLKVYRIMCELAGSPEHHLAAIDRAVAAVKAWQSEHPPRTPNSDAYMARVAVQRIGDDRLAEVIAAAVELRDAAAEGADEETL